ncbi:hypothetical protein [Paenibacillus sp. SYP-B4298]|uniref:hypothetical protein n=1 Tax=Paenibacillus sp. SYP-B4298 TaxID=2996034 RepID=UPI0022DD0143|nr:hypothetical protein [Paenibacillus sp. SYP-B4298]
MKSIKFIFSVVIIFIFAIGNASANGEQIEMKQFHGLTILNETNETSYLEDGTKVTIIRKELKGGLDELKNIISIEENSTSGEKILTHNKLGNESDSIGTYNIPTAQEARSWNSNSLMIQVVGHNGQNLTIKDLSWKVTANVVTYHTAVPGKQVTNLKTKPRLQVNSYGVVGGSTVIYEQKLYEGPEGTSSSSKEFSANGGGAFVYVTAYIGGDFSYDSGGKPHESTRWWNDPGYVSS